MQHPYKIIDADGVYLYTEEKKLIDSISSWWSVIHGYKNPEITAAIKEQADIFSHIMLGSLTHEPVEKLAKKLKDYTAIVLLLAARAPLCACVSIPRAMPLTTVT